MYYSSVAVSAQNGFHCMCLLTVGFSYHESHSFYKRQAGICQCDTWSVCLSVYAKSEKLPLEIGVT